MDYHDIFNSCKTGDLEKVKYLVEAREVELNIRDKWDTTPLYYACLCGHEALVKYLLENGARCEAKTFDGERCLYAALSDSIRKLLRSYKMITSTTMRRDMYDEFLRRLLTDRLYCDAVFRVLGEKFTVHRCILAARCSTLHEKLQRRLEEQKVISIKDLTIDPGSFKMLLTYIYQGRIQLPYENLSTIMLLAKQCGLPLLEEQLEKKLKEKKSFEHSKPGVHIDVLSIDNVIDKESLKTDLSMLADQAIPQELESPLWEMPFPPNRRSIYPDLCIIVDDCKSDYFKALLRDHFDENHGQHNMASITLHDITVDTFKAILYYVYTDYCELTEESVFEVMYIADMYLLPGLKRFCASFIAALIDEDNVFTVLKLTRLFDLPKLEDTCAEFITKNIESMVTREEFAEIILQDAQSVTDREDSDSIDIVDSVRYHLTSRVLTFSEIEGANSKLSLIDNLLESLDLDC